MLGFSVPLGTAPISNSSSEEEIGDVITPVDVTFGINWAITNSVDTTIDIGWNVHGAIDTTEIDTTFEISWNMNGSISSQIKFNWDMLAEGEAILEAVDITFSVNWIYQTSEQSEPRHLMKILAN